MARKGFDHADPTAARAIGNIIRQAAKLGMTDAALIKLPKPKRHPKSDPYIESIIARIRMRMSV